LKNIPVSTLEPNCSFTSPLFLENDYILLTPEIPVTQDIIERLKKWNYSFIFSDGEKIAHYENPLNHAIEGKAGILDKTIQQNEKKERIGAFYFELVDFIDNFINEFKDKNKLDLSELTEKVKEIIELFKTDKDHLLTFTAPRNYTIDNYFIPHVVNTALISLAIGDYLKLPPHRLIDLGNAALLHEIGMTKIPSAIYMKPNDLTQEEKNTISTHTLWGYKILKGFSIPESIASSALEHHERSDGSGYPRKMKGEVINLNSRIVGISCSFDTAISFRPFKLPHDAHTVILNILTTHKNKFDDSIIKALVYSLSVFPLGSAVSLSNNTKGIVFQTNPSDPKFPIVKITHDEKGKKLTEHYLIATSKEKGIFIARTLKPIEMEES